MSMVMFRIFGGYLKVLFQEHLDQRHGPSEVRCGQNLGPGPWATIFIIIFNN